MTSGPTAGQVLEWNGAAWLPATLGLRVFSSLNALTGALAITAGSGVSCDSFPGLKHPDFGSGRRCRDMVKARCQHWPDCRRRNLYRLRYSHRGDNRQRRQRRCSEWHRSRNLEQSARVGHFYQQRHNSIRHSIRSFSGAQLAGCSVQLGGAMRRMLGLMLLFGGYGLCAAG